MKIIVLPPGKGEMPSALGIGVFDGLHLAHRMLLAQTVAFARERNLNPAVLTFDPPPPLYFHQPGYRLISTLEEKISTLEQLKIQTLYLQRFNQSFAAFTPKQFFNWLIEKTQAQVLLVGQNFGFGGNRLGNADLLKELGESQGVEVHILPLVKNRLGLSISSTLIRSLLEKGEIEEANHLLCQPFSAHFQFTNDGHFSLIDSEKILPPTGWYQGLVEGKDSIVFRLERDQILWSQNLQPDENGLLRIVFLSHL
jgi:riboflavin kinase/FMN adenylyltransferase